MQSLYPLARISSFLTIHGHDMTGGGYTWFQSPFEDYILPYMNSKCQLLWYLIKSQSPFEDYVLPDTDASEHPSAWSVGFQSPYEDYILPAGLRRNSMS